ncbi:glutathione S-transferase family protein [Hellea balneolensis]|uniref:glutathione S-transferase family protein n=1 Tax=Hellea balneolensis TaxID=287478 RepID=UPI0003FEF81A|nr:glutathione S-transferase [Hellea balneolensis]
MLKLYDCSTAPSPRRARMLLAEKGIAHETVQIDLRKGEQMSAEFRAVNPRCTVPALVTDEGVLTENAEIAAYLEAVYPDVPMLGSTPLEKALVAKWNWRCEMEGLMSIASALRNATPAMKDRALPGPRNVTQIPELAERGHKQIGWFFEDLNDQLKENDYVAGQNYSVADITATIVVDFAKWVKAFPQDSHTALLEWHKRMKARPSYAL